MRKITKPIFCGLLALCTASGLTAQEPAQDAAPAQNAAELAEQGVQQARDGKTPQALALFRQAIALAPQNVPILRDYAIVLGWGEQYKDAIAVIRQVLALEAEQPDWALREFARSYLFGGETRAALDILDQLINRGDTSEAALLRRALALRWLSRPREARTAYEVAAGLHPSSGAARAGIVYSYGDENKLTDALRAAESGLRDLPADPELLKAKIRVLNWMGRHLEAQRVLEEIPATLEHDREILEDRVYAARWGGDPAGAASVARRLHTDFPDNRATQSLAHQVELEYGAAIAPGFRYISDSDGLIDKTWSGEVAVHLSPAHELTTGYQYRQQQWLNDSLFWRRYDLGWSGVLGRHVRSYASASDVNYGRSASHKIIGDGGLSFVLSDSVRIGVGGGTIAMDAFVAAQNRVTAPFASAEIALVSTPLGQVQARYAHYAFSDGVNRDRADLEAGRELHSQRAFKWRLGWRTSLMWHDRATNDFYSPAAFQSHLALTQGSGRLAPGLDYWVEVAGGWQTEPYTPLENPIQVSARLVWHPTENFRTLIEVVRTTSSLDRVTADRDPYTRRVASIGFSYSFR